MAGMVTSYTVAADPPGNNGTLKVHESGTPSDTENNDPKVCSFNFEGFQFDAGQSGMIVVEPQGGDTPTTDTVSLSFGPTNESGYAQTAYINEGGSLQLDNGHYKSTLYGKDDKGNYTVDLKAKSKVFKVDCEGGRGEEGIPGSAISLVCPTNTYTLTVANTGSTVIAVKINGVDLNIDIKGPAITADFKVGDTLTVLVDGQPATVQGKVLNNYKLPACVGGMGTAGGGGGGSGTTVTPVVASSGFGAGAATDVTSLPVTSGSGAQIAGVITMLGSVLAAAGTYAARARESFSL
jgi:hypothetical protein